MGRSVGMGEGDMTRHSPVKEPVTDFVEHLDLSWNFRHILGRRNSRGKVCPASKMIFRLPSVKALLSAKVHALLTSFAVDDYIEIIPPPKYTTIDGQFKGK